VGKEIVLMRHTHNDADNDDLTVTDEEGPLRVMNEKDFFDLMMYQRSGSTIWRKIVYMQSVVKSRMGIGESYIINYVSHIRTDKQAVERLKSAGM
jgi:hypothetical protein